MSGVLRNPVENGLIGGLELKLSRVVWSGVRTRLKMFRPCSGILLSCMRRLITCFALVSGDGGLGRRSAYRGWHRGGAEEKDSGHGGPCSVLDKYMV